MMRRVFPILLLLLVVCAPSAGAAKKKSKWHALRSEHFYVITDGSTKKAVRITRKMEEFRFLLSQVLPGVRLDPPIPTTVILFKNKKSIRRYLTTTPDGKYIKMSGFMQPGKERMYLVVDTSGRDYVKTAFHEYIHLVMSLTGERIPVWLDEGMAEFYEETEIQGRNFKIGFINEGWLRLLQRNKLIPLDVLQKVDHNSPYYTQDLLRQLFYGQSWVLVHYLMTGREGKGQAQLGRYFQLINAGVPMEEVFRESFQTDYDGLKKELEDYLRQQQFRVYRGSFNRAYKASVGEPVPLSTVVAEAQAADLWINRGDLQEAEDALLELAASGEPSHEVLYRLGRIAMARRNWTEARDLFDSALQENPENLSARYYAAWTLILEGLPQEHDDERRKAGASRVVELLTPVVEGRHNFADAHRMLLSARRMRGDAPTDLIPLAEQMRKANPQDVSLDFLLGELYIREERWEDAEKIYTVLLERDLTPEQESNAERGLGWLRDRNRREQERTRLLEEEAGAENTGETEETSGEEPVRIKNKHPRRPRYTDPVEIAPTPPPPKPARIRYVKGRLVNVVCEGEAAVLTVRTGRRTLRITVRSLAHALVMDPASSGKKLACGAANARVGINYRVQPQKPNIVGVMVSLEFNPT